MAIDNIPIEVSENTEQVTLEVDDTSHPYYVGARAYVTQIPEGAIVTVIDKFGKTEATLLDGNYGNITDISYDPDTRTIKKVNGVVIDDVVTLSDVAISNDYEDLNNLPDIDDIIDAHPVTNLQDGAITNAKLNGSLKYKVNNQATVNVASMVDGSLSSANIVSAITQALALSKYIYIPDGDYTFNLELSQDCTMYLDDECYISTDNNSPAIYAHDCSFNMIGGNVYAGENDDSRAMVGTGTHNGIIFLEDCHDSSIKNLKSSHSKFNGVVQIRNCDNFVLEQSSFKNMLKSAMFIWGHCTNVAVRNCRFENSDTIEGEDYCYFVYTGGGFSEGFTPVDGLIYENNYCDDSEDCALDTHGAKNVIIRNNIILNTVNAITAYNDNLRATRPSGWKMENVLIENNVCDSTKHIRAGSAYPHPYLFVGASNNLKPSEEEQYGTFDAFNNCIVRNNVFRTGNDYSDGAIYTDNMSKGIVFENNEFEFYSGAVATIRFRRAIDFVFENNHGYSHGSSRPQVNFIQSYGKIGGNRGFSYGHSVNFVSYIKGMNNYDTLNTTSPTLCTGDIIYQSGLKVCTNYGLRARYTYAAAIKTFSLTVVNGVASVSDNVYIPKLSLSLTGDASVNAYIDEVLDREHFTLVDGSDNPIPDGTYTATIRDATLATIQ